MNTCPADISRGRGAGNMPGDHGGRLAGQGRHRRRHHRCWRHGRLPDAIAGFRPAEGDTAQPTMPAILAALGDDEDAKERAITASLKRPYDNAKPGDTKVVDGVTYILQGKPPRWHRVDEFLQTPAVSDAQELAAEIDRLMTGQVADHPKLEAAHSRLCREARHSFQECRPATGRAPGQVPVPPDWRGEAGRVSVGRRGRPRGQAHGVNIEAAALALATEQGDFTPEQVAGRWHQGTSEQAKDHLYASTDYALKS